METGTCDYFIPEDLLIEILAYLPVKSLSRFRCVCKSWFTTLQTPNFISKHHSKFNSVDDNRRMLVYYRTSRYKVLSYNTLMPVDEYSKPVYYFAAGWKNAVILGIYNGIVCLHDRDIKKIVFCNPATRERMAISEPLHSYRTSESKYGFCYDFRTDDYKAVKITSMPLSRCKVEVLALSTRKWRNINALFPRGYTIDDRIRSVKISLNGMFSILVCRRYGLDETRREPREYFLLTLDMGNEVSILTPVIEDSNFYCCKPYLAALNNKSVALIKQYRQWWGTISMSIFVLNGYGPDGTWTKLYTIGPLTDIGSTMEFWGNDALFLKNRKEQLVLYDLKTSELIRNFRPACPPQPMHLLEFKESLVSPFLLRPSLS